MNVTELSELLNGGVERRAREEIVEDGVVLVDVVTKGELRERVCVMEVVE